MRSILSVIVALILTTSNLFLLHFQSKYTDCLSIKVFSDFNVNIWHLIHFLILPKKYLVIVCIKKIKWKSSSGQ